MDFYRCCSYYAPGMKTGTSPGGHKLEHRDKKGKLQNSSLKLDGMELWDLVCIIAFPSGPLLSWGGGGCLKVFRILPEFLIFELAKHHFCATCNSEKILARWGGGGMGDAPPKCF